jgi:hypothetical protein
MPGYQTVSQNGTWHPGGAGRLYVNPQQRPGIAEHQLAVGRNLLAPVEFRSAASLDNQGVGVVVALIGAAATLAATGASMVMQKKAAKKQKQAEKKARREAARIEKETAEAEKLAAQNLVSARLPGASIVGTSQSGGGMNWFPVIIGGGAILAVLFLLPGRRSGGRK